MPFASIDEKKARGDFKKTKYMQLGIGTHTVRIIQNPAKKYYVHYIKPSYVTCLGVDCPVCENNKKILYEHPKDYSKVKGWAARSERFFVNVLDKTKARYCADCDKEYKDTNTSACTVCNKPLPDFAPLNKVRVLAKGVTVFQNLELLSNTIRTEGDEVIDITFYDWNLIVNGTGTDTVVTTSPVRFAGNGSPENMEGLELYDLSNSVPELTRSELVDMLNGASMKDIFALRRATKAVDTVSAQPDSALMADIQASVDEIFKK